jgi:hypothetical protein
MASPVSLKAITRSMRLLSLLKFSISFLSIRLLKNAGFLSVSESQDSAMNYKYFHDPPAEMA